MNASQQARSLSCERLAGYRCDWARQNGQNTSGMYCQKVRAHHSVPGTARTA